MPRGHSEPPAFCSTASSELKLYRAFIFSLPIFFTFVLLLLFYLFYLHRRRIDWSSLGMQTSLQNTDDYVSRSELGLKKELRELLPIIMFKESFSIKETLCLVCLGDYQAEDRLQQMPGCGHTFHMWCIDRWLSTHITCPLCRLSLFASAKVPTEASDIRVEVGERLSSVENWSEMSSPSRPEASEETLTNRRFLGLRAGDGGIVQSGFQGEESSPRRNDHEGEFGDAKNENEPCECSNRNGKLCSAH